MIGAVILLSVIGIVFVVLGCLVWKKEKISLLHGYHYEEVAEEDKKAFCTLSGWGVLLIGLGILGTAVIISFTDSAWSFAVFGLGFAAGLGLLIYAGSAYNSNRNR